jgi:hypothetical protein
LPRDAGSGAPGAWVRAPSSDETHFDRISSFVDALVAKADAGQTTLLDDRPFDRVGLVKEMYQAFDVSQPISGATMAAAPSASLPPPQVEPLTGLTSGQIQDPQLQPFFYYCYPCHAKSTSIGLPNFLFGTSEPQVRSQIAALAPTIIARIGDGDSPMPPVNSEQATLFAQPAGQQAKAGMLTFLNSLVQPSN